LKSETICYDAGGYNIENAVFSWFNEGKDYTYENASCAPGAKCGHYFQVKYFYHSHIHATTTGS